MVRAKDACRSGRQRTCAVATIDASVQPSQQPQRPAARPRLAIRRGECDRRRPSGIAPGYVQGNLAILPAALASDFMRFCQLNPKPCPLLAAGAPGDPRLPSLGDDLDIRTDLPPLQGVPQRRIDRRADRHHASTGATIW